MRTLTGQVAWVTGAGSGIGRAAALALGEAGCRVALSARTAETLAATGEALKARGCEWRVEPLDVSNREDVFRAASRIREEFGRIDILVNAAGINVANRHWENLDPEEWQQVVDIDLNGAFYCVAAVLPGMREQGGGLVVNISSWAGRHDLYLAGPAYNAAKHAMLAMNASLNMEEGRHGIRACAICPGEVATPILDRRPVPVSAEERARMLQPEDLGETIAFVARLPPHVCVNEILISPTWNRIYLKEIS